MTDTRGAAEKARWEIIKQDCLVITEPGELIKVNRPVGCCRIAPKVSKDMQREHIHYLHHWTGEKMFPLSLNSSCATRMKYCSGKSKLGNHKTGVSSKDMQHEHIHYLFLWTGGKDVPSFLKL